MITFGMENYMIKIRMHSPKAQTRLKRLRTILPFKGENFIRGSDER